jgi:hypothetical protein
MDTKLMILQTFGNTSGRIQQRPGTLYQNTRRCLEMKDECAEGMLGSLSHPFSSTDLCLQQGLRSEDQKVEAV